MKIVLIIAIMNGCSGKDTCDEVIGEIKNDPIKHSERTKYLNGDWTIDSAMPIEWQELAIQALNGWSLILGESAFHSITIENVNKDQAWSISSVNEAPFGPTAAGQTYGDEGTTIVFAAGTISRKKPNDDINKWFSVVISHELGHAFTHSGDHSEDIDCVMYATGAHAVNNNIVLPTICDANFYNSIWNNIK